MKGLQLPVWITEYFWNRNNEAINFSKAGTETNLTLSSVLVPLERLPNVLQGHWMSQDSRAVPKKIRGSFEEGQQATVPKFSFKREE